MCSSTSPSRAALLSVLLALWLVRSVVDNLVFWPAALILDAVGIRNRPKVVRPDDAQFANLSGYKFKPNYIELGGVRVHYLDEHPAGAGHAKGVVLMLHGEPSWSYLYRKMVKPIADEGYRVIAPDFIGFGKSDKFTSPSDYTHQLHTSTLRQLVQRLDLRDITLVVQDWSVLPRCCLPPPFGGLRRAQPDLSDFSSPDFVVCRGGLTGLSVLPSIDDRVKRLVIMNTGIPPNGRVGPYTDAQAARLDG
eukprot:SAG22_NODE_348_length_11873_cov_4.151435_4_plen_249_part_00